MKTHEHIDLRGLRLAEAIVKKIEEGDIHFGIEKARSVNSRWRDMSSSRLNNDWAEILKKDWSSIRSVLLDTSQRGIQLRQNNPFCGILTPKERWSIMKQEMINET